MIRQKSKNILPATQVQGFFERVDTVRFRGAVWNPVEPERRFAVEFLLDGIPLSIAIANEFESILKSSGDSCYGFSFDIDAGLLAEAEVAEACLANIGLPVGAPIFLHKEGRPASAALGLPPVRWLGGLRFSGAIAQAGDDGSGQKQIVRAVIEEEIVAEATADHWQHNGLLGRDTKALAAFDMFLPKRFADGCFHRVSFIGQSGQHLPGSPLGFSAFPDGLAALVESQGLIESERIRGKMFDLMMPMSFRFSDYAAWRAAQKTLPKARNRLAFGVVLVGDSDVNESIASLESQSHENWVALSIPFSDDAQGFACAELQDFLVSDAAACGFLIFALAGFTLAPNAIERFESAFDAHPRALIAYSDIAIRDARNQTWPIAFSAFDYERLLEQGYCATLFAVSRAALAGLETSKTLNLYRLFNSLVRDPAEARVLHIPDCLGTISGLNTLAAGRALLSATSAHLRAREVHAKVSLAHSSLFPAVKVTRQTAAPTVSIIIPVRNRVELLRGCLESIKPALKKVAAEIIIVDNDSSDPEMLAYLIDIKAPKCRVFRAPGAFNFSKLNNLAAREARGDYLCLLNNDIQALDSLWLTELLSRCVESDAGAVGALLVWPSGVVQHGGVVLGPNFGATHAFNDRLDSDPGYADLLLAARECSAVTAACLLTRRADYLSVGGLDEIFFPINFNDVDYCLKLRARGKRVVFTPHARLLHLESASRGDHQSAHRKGLFERELRSLRTRWMEALLADPSYSPILSLDPSPYSALAWPLRAMEPRWRALPPPADLPSGM